MKTRKSAKAAYVQLIKAAEAKGPDQVRLMMRELALRDLFYFLVYVLGRTDVDRDWLFERCREVEADPDNHLDLWARTHYKSTIITFARTIQDIMGDPEITCCVFSHTKPRARAFLRQIKYELETNARLKALFPDILYQEPRKESARWSEEKGIVVKRQGNPKEATVEAHGLVDGQPTGAHFDLMIYDDVVTRESVSTSEMVKKVTEAWALSLNLASDGARIRYIGTRYHFRDTYAEMMARKAAKPRIHPATHDGKPTGRPVLLSREVLAKKYRSMGSIVFAAQMLQNPKTGSAMGFKKEWLQFYESQESALMNIYLLVDPANSKRKKSDYTVMWVIGLGGDQNYYLLDGVRDRLNLKERTAILFELQRQWQPKAVGYEMYGMQADIEHIEDRQEALKNRFAITPLGGRLSKIDRINALEPIFENKRFYFPQKLTYVDYKGERHNLVDDFIKEEYEAWPVPVHDDMLDCMARILDKTMGVIFPSVVRNSGRLPGWAYKRYQGGFMAR